MHMTDFPKIRSVGLGGVLVTFGDKATDAANRAAIAFRNAVDALALPQIEESSSTLVSAFFRVDLAQHGFAPLHAALADVVAQQDWLTAALPGGRALWTLTGTSPGRWVLRRMYRKGRWWLRCGRFAFLPRTRRRGGGMWVSRPFAVSGPTRRSRSC